MFSIGHSVIREASRRKEVSSLLSCLELAQLIAVLYCAMALAKLSMMNCGTLSGLTLLSTANV